MSLPAENLDSYIGTGFLRLDGLFIFPDDWRLFKKKKNLILPVLILLNLVKIKLLMLPVLVGVHFIKKLIVIGGLFVPGILKHLKICKVSPHAPMHPFQAWGTAAEAPVDYPTGAVLSIKSK